MCEGGGNCLKYLKKEWNRKQGRGNKDFRKGGKLGQEVGALKGGGGGLESPYELCGRTLQCSSAYQKNFIIHFFLEILHFKESCNLIGWQHFDP